MYMSQKVDWKFVFSKFTIGFLIGTGLGLFCKFNHDKGYDEGYKDGFNKMVKIYSKKYDHLKTSATNETEE